MDVKEEYILWSKVQGRHIYCNNKLKIMRACNNTVRSVPHVSSGSVDVAPGIVQTERHLFHRPQQVQLIQLPACTSTYHPHSQAQIKPRPDAIRPSPCRAWSAERVEGDREVWDFPRSAIRGRWRRRSSRWRRARHPARRRRRRHCSSRTCGSWAWRRGSSPTTPSSSAAASASAATSSSGSPSSPPCQYLPPAPLFLPFYFPCWDELWFLQRKGDLRSPSPSDHFGRTTGQLRRLRENITTAYSLASNF